MSYGIILPHCFCQCHSKLVVLLYFTSPIGIPDWNAFYSAAIARLLDVTTTTVTRRMHAYGIGIRRLYSQISNRRLDEVVHEIILEFPSA